MASQLHAFSREIFERIIPSLFAAKAAGFFPQMDGVFLMRLAKLPWSALGMALTDIGRAMAEQSSQIAFAHTSQFDSIPAQKLAARLLQLAPANFQNGGRVYFTSGGSEATETAIKLARQYHLESGQPQRYGVISRRQSYHGSTLGAMSVSGNVARRAPYQPLLPEWGHVSECFAYHHIWQFKRRGLRPGLR